MRVSICVGQYAKNPYCIRALDVQVYCIEELCYCFRENAFLLDVTILDEQLVRWIGEECKLVELSMELHKMVSKKGTLSGFVLAILNYVGLYEPNVLKEVEHVLKAGSGLNSVEKQKKQIDYLVQQKKYFIAVKRYDEILKKWDEESGEYSEEVGAVLKATIIHNKAVALAGMMEYHLSAKCFWEAYQLHPIKEHYMPYLASKRAELSEREYLQFVTEQPRNLEYSLEIEQQMKNIQKRYDETEIGYRLAQMCEWRDAGEIQKYDEELERMILAMKENYRLSMSE